MPAIDMDRQKKPRFCGFFCCPEFEKSGKISLLFCFECTNIKAEVVESGLKWCEMVNKWFVMEHC